MRIVEAQEARERLTMPVCIDLMRQAFMDLESGKASQPLRSIVMLPHGEKFGFMPAYLGEHTYFGAKVLSAFPQNMGTEYPSHIGYVMMFESEHGVFQGMADATVITEVMSLPHKLREAVLLRYYQGMKLKEVADALHISPSTVKQRLDRANTILHSRLERWYFNED